MLCWQRNNKLVSITLLNRQVLLLITVLTPFLNWTIINSKKEENTKYKWIYKWKIEWIITDLKNFEYKKDKKQILIIKNLDFNLYDKLDYINWLIIKNWNLLSHNSIILREYKIPSLIKYKAFYKLKNWEKIIIYKS